MQIPLSCLDFCRYVFVFVNVMLTLQEGLRGGWAPLVGYPGTDPVLV